MQFSLPVSTFPMPAGSTAGAGNSAAPADPAAKESGDPLSGCFESLLSSETPVENPAEKDDDDAVEQAAAFVAASLWAPLITTTVPPPSQLSLSVTPENVTGQILDEETPSGETTGVSSPRQFPVSSRAFAPVLPENASAVLPQPVPSDQPVKPNSPEAPGQLASANAPGQAVAAAAPGRQVADAAVANDATVQPAVFAVSQVLPSKRPILPAPTAPLASTTTAASADVSVLPVEGRVAVPVSEAVVEAPVVEINDAGAVAVTLNPGQEKIAARPPLPAVEQKAPSWMKEKQFLLSADKVVTTESESVGISVAKVSAIMPSAAPARSKSISVSESTTAFSFSTGTASVATLLTPEAPTPAATVRETMAAVISAVDALERRMDVQQKSIDLNFHVGNEKLGLRVELRDGTVHTTFRTESSEMNSAIVREWNAIVQPALGREIRLADPVFNSSSSNGNNSSFGSLGQGTPHDREQKANPAFPSALKRDYYDTAVSDTTSAPAPAANSSQLLNVLA